MGVINYPDSIDVNKFKYLIDSVTEKEGEFNRYPYITAERLKNNDICFRGHRIYLLCPLQEYIAYKTKTDIEIPLSPLQYKAYEVGKLLHPLLRCFFKEGELHGNYSCIKCDYASDKIEPYFLSKKCPNCGSPTQYKEINLSYNNIGGSIDALYKSDSDEFYYIIDFKTVSDSSFKLYSSNKNINMQYIYQLNTYMFLMKQCAPEIKIADISYLFYLNKATGEILKVPVEYNDVIVYDILRTVEVIKYYILEDKEPPRFLKCRNPSCNLHS